jgi:hypothetical protein
MHGTYTTLCDNYPIMVLADTFGKIIGHNWTRMRLWNSQVSMMVHDHRFGLVLTLTLSVRGCATPSAPLSAKNFAAENV